MTDNVANAAHPGMLPDTSRSLCPNAAPSHGRGEPLGNGIFTAKYTLPEKGWAVPTMSHWTLKRRLFVCY